MFIIRFIKRNYFLICILLIFALMDNYLVHNNPIATHSIFDRNDFELTCEAHPEKVWDKVFFGNSVVISSFIEEQSSSGFINLGLDYGVVTDLDEMISKKLVNIGSELVIGLNYLTLYDNFETNPTYMWHKNTFEPYVYFERDKFYPVLTNGFKNVLDGLPFDNVRYDGQKKAVYHGTLTDDELKEKEKIYDEEYWHLDLSNFQNNINALENIATYCEENNIRVRIVWMPWNFKADMPKLCYDLQNEVGKVCKNHKIEVIDFTDKLDGKYFYDLGHLNYEVGAPHFTKMLDRVL